MQIVKYFKPQNNFLKDKTSKNEDTIDFFSNELKNRIYFTKGQLTFQRFILEINSNKQTKELIVNSFNYLGKQGSTRIINSEESSNYYPWVARIIRETTKDVKTINDELKFTKVEVKCMGAIISRSQ